MCVCVYVITVFKKKIWLDKILPDAGSFGIKPPTYSVSDRTYEAQKHQIHFINAIFYRFYVVRNMDKHLS